MKKLFIALCGLLLFSGLQVSADNSSSQEEQVLEIVDVEYDYCYRPESEYWYADIIGEMNITIRVKGINFFHVEFSGGHYDTPEEAPLQGKWLQCCNPEGEQLTVHFPIILWGGWARCGYYLKGNPEIQYTPYVWSTDYIDQETLDMYFGGIEGINANTPLTIEIHGREISISGITSASPSVTITDLAGRTILFRTLYPESGETRLNVENLNSGIYILSIFDGNNSSNSKIQLK